MIMMNDSVPDCCAGLLRSLPRRRPGAFCPPGGVWDFFLLPETLEEFDFESVSGFEDEPEVAFEAFLTSIFSSCTLMLLLPPRRGPLSFQRTQRVTTGMMIVKRIVTPRTIHSSVDPNMRYDSGNGSRQVVWQTPLEDIQEGHLWSASSRC